MSALPQPQTRPSIKHTGVNLNRFKLNNLFDFCFHHLKKKMVVFGKNTTPYFKIVYSLRK